MGYQRELTIHEQKAFRRMCPPEQILKLVREYRKSVPMNLRGLIFHEIDDHCSYTGAKYPIGYAFGLCTLIEKSPEYYGFGLKEKNRLILWLKKNRPSGLSSDSSLIISKARFYWNPGDWDVRVTWLKKQIKDFYALQ